MFCRSFSGIALFPTEPLAGAAVKYKEGKKAPHEHCSSATGERKKSQNSSWRDPKRWNMPRWWNRHLQPWISSPKGFWTEEPPGTGHVLVQSSKELICMFSLVWGLRQSTHYLQSIALINGISVVFIKELPIEVIIVCHSLSMSMGWSLQLSPAVKLDIFPFLWFEPFLWDSYF